MTLLLAAGNDRVVIDPQAGGRLASLTIGGVERLVGPSPEPVDNPELHWGCYLMAPWAGRIGGAVLRVGESDITLQAKDGPNALHGLVTDQPWDVVEASPGAAVLRCDLDWAPGGAVTSAFRLEPGELSVTATIAGQGEAFPAWLGWHPWFARPAAGDMAVLVRGDEVLVLDESLPTGERAPVSGETDLRAGPDLGDRVLDHVYPDVQWPAEVRWADLTLSIQATPAATVVVHTPPRGVCVEPQTAWPDAAALAARGVPGTGLDQVTPDEPLQATMIWRW